MADSQLTPTLNSLPQPNGYAQSDIASVCPICKHGFKDEHFTTLIWLDDHTPAHLTCHEQETPNANP